MKKVFALILIIVILSLILIPGNHSFAAATKYTQSLKSGIPSFPKEYQSIEHMQQLKLKSNMWVRRVKLLRIQSTKVWIQQ